MNEVIPVILSVLLIILIVVLIILGIKLIKTLYKVDNLINDVDKKVQKLDGMFDFVDTTSSMLTSISDRVIGLVSTGLNSLFSKKRKDEE